MGEFGVSAANLRDLMEYRGSEAKEKIHKDFGGIEGLCERLQTDPNNGFPACEKEIERRRSFFGSNKIIPQEPPKSFFQRVAGVFKADKATTNEKPVELKQFTAIRGGKSVQVVVDDLVVGDVIQIKKGDLVPVDGVVIESNDLKIDESSLTGEMDLIKKHPDYDPMILSETEVAEGSAKVLVTAVGGNSQSGIIITLLGAAYNIAEEEGRAARR